MRGLLLTGFVFGSAIAVKITSIIFCAPIVFFWLAFSFGQVRARRLLPRRFAGRGHGDRLCALGGPGISVWRQPRLPAGQDCLSGQAEYRAMAERSAALNSSYPLTPKGMIAAFADLPEKLAYLGPDVMFWLVLMSALTLIFSRGRHARFLGWSLLGFYGGFFAMKGRNEIGRYFGMGYPVAAPAVAMAFAFLRGQMQRQGKTTPQLAPGQASALIASATRNYYPNQLAQAQWPVFQWKFSPSSRARRSMPSRNTPRSGTIFIFATAKRDRAGGARVPGRRGLPVLPEAHMHLGRRGLDHGLPKQLSRKRPSRCTPTSPRTTCATSSA